MTAKFHIKKTRDHSDCLDLRYGIWPDDHKYAKYVLFANGRTEWIEKYDYVAADLALPTDTGFVSWDHRGQGDSGGARAMVDHYDSYAKDAAKVARIATNGQPYVVMSHSMGGLISLYATLKGYLKPQALVLASPLLRLPQDVVPGVIAKPIAEIANKINLGAVSTGAGSHTKGVPFESNQLTHSYSRYLNICLNPYPLPGATFGWVHQTFAALQDVFNPELLKDLNVPVLLMHGSKESVVDISGFRDWIAVAQEHAKVPVKYRVIQGARHELFSELDKYYKPALGLTKDWFADFLAD